MSSKDNGDLPAMPITNNGTTMYHGLTKREYFAAAVMQGLTANPVLLENLEAVCAEIGKEPKETLAALTLEYTDALLAALDNE